VTGSLVDLASGRDVATRIVRAAGPFGRAFGLLGRSSLEPDEGMWFDGCASIHTFGMRMPVDALFVDARGRIVAVFDRLQPWRTAVGRGARDVVELAPGTCARAGLAVGAAIEMRWRSSM
jgi:hypothetical protein